MNRMRRSQGTAEAGSREAYFYLGWSWEGFPQRCSLGYDVKERASSR